MSKTSNGSSLTKGKVSHNVTVISTLRDRTPQPQPKPLDDGESVWGGPSSFSWGSNARDFDEGIIPHTTWEYPDDNPEDPTPPDEPLNTYIETWVEIDRKETEVRITGTGGAYVDFMRVDEVTFRLPPLPDGREHQVVQRFKTADGAASGTSSASA